MGSLLSQIIDIALGALLLRALLGWLATNPRVIRFLIPLAAAALALAFNLAHGLPVLTTLILFVLAPLSLLLLLSSLSEMRHLSRKATLREMFLLERGKTRGAAPELAAALRDLSRERTGALIVLPRGDDLDRLVTGGESYDARLTKSLLVSLFNPKAPRHDGALVLQGDRIVRVGAVLPLASAEGAREEWGTRHLAAAGLSENCDAEVIVVSEERGTVSLARDGKLQELPIEPEGALAARLEKVIGETSGRWNTRLRSASRSFLLWGLAVGIAIIGSLNGQTLARRFFTRPELVTSREVPINLSNLPPGLFVDDLSAGKCELLVQTPGSSFVLGAVRSPVIIDLSGYPPGRFDIRLTRELVPDLPRDWVIYRFTPERVKGTLARIRRLNVPIVPKFDGLPKGFKIERVETVPPALLVDIRDARWRVGQTLETFPVDLSRVRTTGEQTFEAWLNLPATVTPVALNPESYRVSLTVQVEQSDLPSK